MWRVRPSLWHDPLSIGFLLWQLASYYGSRCPPMAAGFLLWQLASYYGSRCPPMAAGFLVWQLASYYGRCCAGEGAEGVGPISSIPDFLALFGEGLASGAKAGGGAGGGAGGNREPRWDSNALSRSKDPDASKDPNASGA